MYHQCRVVMLDFNSYRMGPGYVCKFVFFIYNINFLLSTVNFYNKVAVGHFFLNVPNTVIWEGEGEVSVSMPE